MPRIVTKLLPVEFRGSAVALLTRLQTMGVTWPGKTAQDVVETVADALYSADTEGHKRGYDHGYDARAEEGDENEVPPSAIRELLSAFDAANTGHWADAEECDRFYEARARIERLAGLT